MTAAPEIARQIVDRLRRAGFIAYYAGGCVRDLLRGVAPNDYDIVTSARPEEVQRLFRRTVAVGAQFGVIVAVEHGLEFQIATFRADGIYIDGRHPTAVEFAGPEQDAARRDFTINGMFYDPLAATVIDYVGGRADLAARVVRAIGDPAARFREDRLRVLRAVRFAATLGFEIEPATWDALRAAAAGITAVSAERSREELARILIAPNRLRGFDLLDAGGLLGHLLPEVERLKGCEQPPQFHPEGDVFVHTRLMIGLLPAAVSVPLAFATLLHDIGKPGTQTCDPAEGRIRFSGHDKLGAEMTAAAMERLRFSREEIDAAVEMVAQHMVFKDAPRMRVAKLKRFMARPTFADELVLHKVDCESSHGALDNYGFLVAKREEFAREPLIPPPLLTGHDLIALGWTPGPVFAEILDAVQTRQLEGALASRDEALAWVRTNYPGPR